MYIALYILVISKKSHKKSHKKIKQTKKKFVYKMYIYCNIWYVRDGACGLLYAPTPADPPIQKYIRKKKKKKKKKKKNLQNPKIYFAIYVPHHSFMYHIISPLTVCPGMFAQLGKSWRYMPNNTNLA